MSAIAIPPVTDELTVSIRAFAGPQWTDIKEPKKGGLKKAALDASPWALIFDTETTIDAGQALRFGTYQLRHDDRLRESGIFYDPEGVSPAELERLRAYAETEGLRLLTREGFADQVFFGIAWQLHASIIGFNLPFDISRIAIAHGSARKEMRGGFSFRLSHQKIYPHVVVKHLSRRSAFIRFAATAGQLDSRGQRRRGVQTPVRRGHFIDVKTLAGALCARSFSLDTLSDFLGVENGKLASPDFGKPVDAEMIRYAVRDTQATWECYVALRDKLAKLGLRNLVAEKVYSEASIGKAYIRAMGIMPFQKLQPNFPRQMLANIMGSYFGGRSEVRIRRELRQVMLCDFLSMYPTVCTLMGLWRFVIAEEMSWRDATDETREFLQSVDLVALQSQSTWRELATLVRVLPNADIFPVRAAYSGEAQTTIGANRLSGKTPIWMTLADCIASKLLSGKAPEVIEAITFEPGSIQSELCSIEISGNPNYRVDPAKTDFFKRVIELRKSVQGEMAKARGPNADALKVEQNTLKIIANSTSYGMWVEVNVATRPQRFNATVHSSTGNPFSFEIDKAEEPGPFFHPLLATLITGAARLMLAISERLVADADLEWAFCDTDSMAIAKPDPLSISDFYERVRGIVAWFEALNPYAFDGSILKIEDVNNRLGSGEAEPLYCWAVSAKRYALFNLTTDRQPIMRKVSAHGLGHLISPYKSNDAPSHIPAPDKSVLNDGVQRWHVDLWHQIVCAALDGNPDRVALDFHPTMHGPAASQYSATSPELLNWFHTHNAGSYYRDQVKPFGFLLSFSAKPDWTGELIVTEKRRRRSKPKRMRPIASFNRDLSEAALTTFDRETGKLVPIERLKSYAEAIAQYHLHPESKFLNGDCLDRGTTERRHVRMIGACHIGKESHDWEQQAVLGLKADALPDYGHSAEDAERVFADLSGLIARVGQRKAAKALDTTPSRLSRIQPGTMPRDVANRLPAAMRLFEQAKGEREQSHRELKVAVERDGLRATARRLEIDPSNLRRRLNLNSIG